MLIDPKTEQLTRKMLGHAIRHETDELAALIGSLGSDAFAAATPLLVYASAYTAVDVCGRWPTDADLHEVAARAAKSATRLDVSEQEIFEYLASVALGSRRLDDVFSDEGVGTVPLYATANLLSKFAPQEMEWWEYLDQIWDASQAADRASLSLLPSLLLRARREQGS